MKTHPEVTWRTKGYVSCFRVSLAQGWVWLSSGDSTCMVCSLVGVCHKHYPVELAFCVLFVLGPLLWHMEVLRLGSESELQLLAYATATAMPDPSHFCDLHHSSQQHGILNLLSEARDRTRIIMGTSQINFR